MPGLLPIPKALTALIESGFWPRTHDEARKQNLRCLLGKETIQRFAPEEDRIFFLPPPFHTVQQVMTAEHRFWSDPRVALHEIDPAQTLLIGDFGLGSDAPLALDYRPSIMEPRVIRLRWNQDGNHWIEVASTFEPFARFLT